MNDTPEWYDEYRQLRNRQDTGGEALPPDLSRRLEELEGKVRRLADAEAQSENEAERLSAEVAALAAQAALYGQAADSASAGQAAQAAVYDAGSGSPAQAAVAAVLSASATIPPPPKPPGNPPPGPPPPPPDDPADSDGKRRRVKGIPVVDPASGSDPTQVFGDIRDLMRRLLGEAVKGNQQRPDLGSKRRQVWDATNPLRWRLRHGSGAGRVIGGLADHLPAGLKSRIGRTVLGRKPLPTAKKKPQRKAGGWDDEDWKRAAQSTQESLAEKISKYPGADKLGLTPDAVGKMSPDAQRSIAKQLGINPDDKGMTADELRKHVEGGGDHPSVPKGVQRATRKAAQGAAEEAAGGEAAAAAGEGLEVGGAAGAVALPAAAIVAVALAFKVLHDETMKLSRQQEAYSRDLARFSPSQAASLAMLDINRTLRMMDAGEYQSPGADRRNKAVDRYEQAVQPLENAWENAKNNVAAALVDQFAKLADVLSKMAPMIEVAGQAVATGVEVAGTMAAPIVALEAAITKIYRAYFESAEQKKAREDEERKKKGEEPGFFGDFLQRLDEENKAKRLAEESRMKRLREQQHRVMRR